MKSAPPVSTTPSTTEANEAPPAEQGHAFEARIRHDLMACPDLQFSSLVVHRIPDGVCLEGVVSTRSDRDDVSQLVRQVAGVNAVLNHLVMRPDSQPQKG